MTPEQVRKDIAKRDRKIGVPFFRHSANRGNGRNKNYSANPEGQRSIYSTHIARMENAEGNMALVPIRSKITDRSWVEIHILDPNERKIRRMKNKMRKLHRSWRRRKPHGRTVRVAVKG